MTFLVSPVNTHVEGNCCYRFSTIRNYVAKTAQPAITRIVEAGVNVGNIALTMHKYFPVTRIIGFEAVREFGGSRPLSDDAQGKSNCISGRSLTSTLRR